MKKYLLIFAFVGACLSGYATSKTDKDMQNFRYDIECAGNGTNGTYLVKVWSYAKKAEKAEQAALKNAVHGVIFKGYAGGNNCVGQSPIARQMGVELEYADFFKSFFAENGEFRKFASAVGGSTETIKVGKEYKVGVVVSVRKDELRKALEAAGVIKGLGSGF